VTAFTSLPQGVPPWGVILPRAVGWGLTVRRRGCESCGGGQGGAGARLKRYSAGRVTQPSPDRYHPLNTGKFPECTCAPTQPLLAIRLEHSLDQPLSIIIETYATTRFFERK
jgi:hypothetical protein